MTMHGDSIYDILFLNVEQEADSFKRNIHSVVMLNVNMTHDFHGAFSFNWIRNKSSLMWFKGDSPLPLQKG